MGVITYGRRPPGLHGCLENMVHGRGSLAFFNGKWLLDCLRAEETGKRELLPSSDHMAMMRSTFVYSICLGKGLVE